MLDELLQQHLIFRFSFVIMIRDDDLISNFYYFWPCYDHVTFEQSLRYLQHYFFCPLIDHNIFYLSDVISAFRDDLFIYNSNIGIFVYSLPFM